MSYTEMLGRLLGIEELRSVDSTSISFGARWAATSPFWVICGVVALALAAAIFYNRFQRRGGRVTRVALVCFRAVALIVLLLILADPILSLRTTNQPQPLLWVLLDGTESMQIEDDLPSAEHARLADAVGLASTGRASRADFVHALVSKPTDNLLRKLEEKCRVQVFVLDNPDRVRQVGTSDASTEELDLTEVAAELEDPQGQVTAIGTALQDLAARHATTHLAGLVVLSDFGQNTGPAPIGSRTAPANRLGAPIYTVGVGPASAVNLAVELQTRPVMKKAEVSSLEVSIRQIGLDGQRAKVVVSAQAVATDTPAEPIIVGEKEVELRGPTAAEQFSFTPKETGQFRFTATVEPLPQEVVSQDNSASSAVEIRDDFLRVLFVEHEPTWEWRFIKEVFHRDRLVGMRGFRTYLSSADRSVRRTNELFLPNLTPDRKEFFANDVIFIGDMPAGALNDRFCNMAREFVTKFGGGLVVMAGPRFGINGLADTPLADILPVQLAPGAAIRDARPFQLRLTPMAFQQDFMRLGNPSASPDEVQQHWSGLGTLPWYQPVKAPHLYGTTVLAEHPTDRCADGSAQPLIAMRQFERGSVVYLGFNETWRLRRKHGEQYYRQFWGQLLHRLGLRRAMGANKRFDLRTDQQQYQPDDKAIVTVVAYDENFDELTAEKLQEQKLSAQLVVPGKSEQDRETREITIPLLRAGVFETQIPLFASGRYEIHVKDPISGDTVEHDFEVASLSVERRTATRNVSLQEQISAANPGGKMYDLATVSQLPDDLDLQPITETSVKVIPLWSTWLCFAVVVGALLAEWTLRKVVNLP